MFIRVPKGIKMTQQQKSADEIVNRMIQLAENNRDRARTWHWFKDEVLFQLTLVDESRVA